MSVGDIQQVADPSEILRCSFNSEYLLLNMDKAFVSFFNISINHSSTIYFKDIVGETVFLQRIKEKFDQCLCGTSSKISVDYSKKDGSTPEKEDYTLLISFKPLINSSNLRQEVFCRIHPIKMESQTQPFVHLDDSGYKDIFQQMEDAILLVDAESGYIYEMNRALKERFFEKQSFHVPTNINDFLPNEGLFSREKMSIWMEKALQEGPQQYEYQRMDWHQQPIWEEIHISHISIQNKSVLMILIKDITDFKEKERLLQQSLKEKDEFIEDVHHRVKNNLQTIISLISLQAKQIKSEPSYDLFIKTQARIKSLSIFYERLHQTAKFERVNISDYIESLASYLSGLYLRHHHAIEVRFQKKAVFLSVEKAVPCGILFNEILSNSFKHAFPNDKEGHIFITLENHEVYFTCTLRDDGIGFPYDTDIFSSNSFGFQLITGLVKQLEGKIERENLAKGTSFQLTIPIK